MNFDHSIGVEEIFLNGGEPTFAGAVQEHQETSRTLVIWHLEGGKRFPDPWRTRRSRLLSWRGRGTLDPGVCRTPAGGDARDRLDLRRFHGVVIAAPGPALRSGR